VTLVTQLDTSRAHRAELAVWRGECQVKQKE
jgi:hypothetical protein